jgi:4-hydroxy-tetrahydrodipicolinate synthase
MWLRRFIFDYWGKIMVGPMFRGSMPALITPFSNGSVDEKAFQDFVQWQIDEGSHGVVPCGTTGESPTLTHDEDMRVTRLCVEVAGGKVPVIAGTGSNSTEEAIRLTQGARASGADAALIVTPYYNRPNQEGLYQHFKAIHDAVEIPIVIYNIPGRSIVDMTVETMARLAELPNIVGVKDATADLARPARTRRVIGDDFSQLSGEDATAVPFLAQGGHGCISVTANVAPALCAEVQNAWQARDFDRVDQLNQRLMPLHEALFMEPSPGGAKYALSLLGHCENRLRLPMLAITEACQTAVRKAMVHAGLLN